MVKVKENSWAKIGDHYAAKMLDINEYGEYLLSSGAVIPSSVVIEVKVPKSAGTPKFISDGKMFNVQLIGERKLSGWISSDSPYCYDLETKQFSYRFTSDEFNLWYNEKDLLLVQTMDEKSGSITPSPLIVKEAKLVK